MTPDNTLSDHISKTYKATRNGLAIIAIIFPLLLLVGGYILAKPPVHLQGSMSAYYHASVFSEAIRLAKLEKPDKPDKHDKQDKPDKQDMHPSEGVMRNWFVGLLFALGIILVLYRGFTPLENLALGFAGVMALGVALFPMAWGDEFTGVHFKFLGLPWSLHGAFAVGLFLCVSYVCIFRASDTVQLMPDIKDRKRYHCYYKWLGWMMIASPLMAWVLSGVLHKQSALIFFIEFAGIWVFAGYWLLKGREISKSDADRKAARGELQIVDSGKRHPFRKIEIQAKPSSK